MIRDRGGRIGRVATHRESRSKYTRLTISLNSTPFPSIYFRACPTPSRPFNATTSCIAKRRLTRSSHRFHAIFFFFPPLFLFFYARLRSDAASRARSANSFVDLTTLLGSRRVTAGIASNRVPPLYFTYLRIPLFKNSVFQV